MKFLQEKTDWKVPNHLYVLDDSKDRMIAYRPVGKTSFMIFKKPIKISLSGRKFTEVKNTFGFTMQEEVSTDKVHKVIGSKGEIYNVTETVNGFACSCAGFKFRSKCKHAEMIQNKVIV